MKSKILFLFLLFFVGGAMAKQVLGVTYNGISGVNAASTILIDGDAFKFILPGSSSDEFYGVGVYRGMMDADQKKLVDKFIQVVLAKKTWPPSAGLDYTRFSFSYSDGKGVDLSSNIYFQENQDDSARELLGIYSNLAKSFYETGHKIAHVTADYNVVKQEDGKYLLTLVFTNSGSEVVIIGSPEEWSGTYKVSGAMVWAVPSGLIGRPKLGDTLWLNFGGAQLLNKTIKSKEGIKLFPGQSQTIQFIGDANDGSSQKEGLNNFSGNVYFKIQLPESQWMRADLLLPTKQITLPNR